MGFLIRCAFWLSLVLLIIPIHTNADDGAESTVGPVQAFVAAREAVQDVTGICSRKPEVCTTGRAALHTIGARARASARYAYKLLGDDDDAPDTSITTGTVARNQQAEPIAQSD